MGAVPLDWNMWARFRSLITTQRAKLGTRITFSLPGHFASASSAERSLCALWGGIWQPATATLILPRIVSHRRRTKTHFIFTQQCRGLGELRRTRGDFESPRKTSRNRRISGTATMPAPSLIQTAAGSTRACLHSGPVSSSPSTSRRRRVA